jgi:hypothetical protein
MSNWSNRGLPVQNFDTWFNEAYPIKNYIDMAELYAARGPNGEQLTNQQVQLVRKHPEMAEKARRLYNISNSGMAAILGK